MASDNDAIKDLRKRAEALKDGCYSPGCESGCECQCANLGGPANGMTVEAIMERLPLFPKAKVPRG